MNNDHLIPRLCKIEKIDPRTLPSGTQVSKPRVYYSGSGHERHYHCFLAGAYPLSAGDPRQICVIGGMPICNHDEAPPDSYGWEITVHLTPKLVEELFLGEPIRGMFDE